MCRQRLLFFPLLSLMLAALLVRHANGQHQKQKVDGGSSRYSNAAAQQVRYQQQQQLQYPQQQVQYPQQQQQYYSYNANNYNNGGSTGNNNNGYGYTVYIHRYSIDICV